MNVNKQNFLSPFTLTLENAMRKFKSKQRNEKGINGEKHVWQKSYFYIKNVTNQDQVNNLLIKKPIVVTNNNQTNKFDQFNFIEISIDGFIPQLYRSLILFIYMRKLVQVNNYFEFDKVYKLLVWLDGK